MLHLRCKRIDGEPIHELLADPLIQQINVVPVNECDGNGKSYMSNI